MIHCPNCHEEIDEGYDMCWNCNYSLTDNKVIDTVTPENSFKREIDCLRCLVKMSFMGNFRFREGTQYGFFGNLFELFENSESFDLFTCPKCGKVEFFIPEKGNQV